MPKTIKRWGRHQSIGGVFSERTHADRAIEAFVQSGVSKQDIEEVVSLNDTARQGRILLIIHNVKNPAPIIDIFDAHKAQYNPDGSYNLRNDVAGLTVGAVAGAVLGGTAGAVEGGIIGTIVTGPLGSTVGAVVGAVVGGGIGAAVGEITEHRK